MNRLAFSLFWRLFLGASERRCSGHVLHARTLIDGSGAPPPEKLTILIERIRDVGPSSKVSVSAGAAFVDASVSSSPPCIITPTARERENAEANCDITLCTAYDCRDPGIHGRRPLQDTPLPHAGSARGAVYTRGPFDPDSSWRTRLMRRQGRRSRGQRGLRQVGSTPLRVSPQDHSM